jgi:hypothetical protein
MRYLEFSECNIRGNDDIGANNNLRSVPGRCRMLSKFTSVFSVRDIEFVRVSVAHVVVGVY